MIISSYVKHIWKSTDLKDKFSSSLDVLDEMRSIRCIEHKGKAKFITPFVGKQIDIAQAFGFEIPEGSGTKYKSRKVKVKGVKANNFIYHSDFFVNRLTGCQNPVFIGLATCFEVVKG